MVMIMNKIKGFTFYRSYYESICDLKENDKKDILNAILDYVFEDKKPHFKGIKKTFWTLIEPNLNTSKNRSNENSGAPKGNKNACKTKEKEENEKQSKNNQTTINDLYDKDKDKDKDKEWENNSTYTPNPTLDLVVCFGKELGVDEKYCRTFFNNYESKGWKIGKNKIENWKAKFEQWVEEDLEKGNIKIKQKQEYDTRKFFEDENGLFKYDSEGVKHYV